MKSRVEAAAETARLWRHLKGTKKVMKTAGRHKPAVEGGGVRVPGLQKMIWPQRSGFATETEMIPT